MKDDEIVYLLIKFQQRLPWWYQKASRLEIPTLKKYKNKRLEYAKDLITDSS
jgi:hypothetical protein